ncbi:hypothetical protein N8H10_01885 [Curtobacterium flaccumfaciens pv. poinsettiae]|nr:hypothetical protein [Curtobacterium flaccumfaciens]MCU0151530.1 hypothetical protein [Curtobacterium flaccumfaciens pv. poinsettiae]
MFTQQPCGDDEPGDHEEDVDAEEPTARPTERMVEDDHGDGDPTEALDVWSKGSGLH